MTYVYFFFDGKGKDEPATDNRYNENIMETNTKQLGNRYNRTDYQNHLRDTALEHKTGHNAKSALHARISERFKLETPFSWEAS